MHIAFIHARSSFLPEIEAYHRFFKQRHIETSSVDFKDAKSVKADVMWWIMGFSLLKTANAITIHEYTSASAPPFGGFKNLIKSRLIPKPHFRLLLNPYVKAQMHFDDNVPFGFRDMGVDLSVFYPQPAKEKAYDFIYVGNVHYTRALTDLLNCFSDGAMRNHSLLILSRDYESLANRFAGSGNIIFQGPVSATEVPGYINKAKFGINYIPDRPPYNGQTSTKLLEYAACQVPIITTSYQWIRNFQHDYGGKYFYLEKDLSNFQWEAVNRFVYAFPELSSWQWEKQIAQSGVLAFLEKKFSFE